MSSDVLLKGGGAAAVVGRITNEYNSTKPPRLNSWMGYYLWVDEGGAWRLEVNLQNRRRGANAHTILRTMSVPLFVAASPA